MSALSKAGVLGGAAVVAAVVVNKQFAKPVEKLGAKPGDSYPPNGLSPGVKKLPEWIQLGCGST